MFCGDIIVNFLFGLPEQLIKLLLVLIPIIAFVIVAVFVFKKISNKYLKLIIVFICLPSFLVFALFSSLLIYLSIFEQDNNARASKYFQMNAAIKNTCYLDPNKVNCPKNLEGLLSLYPNDFNPINQKAKLIYHYYPDSNEYTLIVRDKPEGAVIFDPRLSTIEKGYDFKEYSVETCGRDRIISPPTFPGPWEEIGEWIKLY